MVFSKSIREEWEARGRKAHQGERELRERQDREQRERRAKMEEELDAEEAAAEAEPVARDPVEALRMQLEQERANHAALARGEYPKHPPGFAIWQQEKKVLREERRQRKREAAEREAGLPELRAKWEANQGAIQAEAADAWRAENERHLAARQEIDRRKADQLDALGGYPTLENRQPVAA